MLVVAGRQERAVCQELHVVVQHRDRRLGGRQLVLHSTLLLAFACSPFSIEPVLLGRELRHGARADVRAHDAPVFPSGAHVVATAAGARFPAHGVV